jgi:phospholipid/cholesterol/gamma-HCH transport system substrate-binding protein
VGSIKSVEANGERFGLIRISVDVDSDILIKEDSMLVLKQDGLLGIKYIEISPGTPESPRAAAGATLKGYVPPAITDLTASIEEPLATVNRVLGHLDKILGDPGNQENISTILSDTKTLLEGLNEQVQKIGSEAAKTGEQARQVLGDAHDMIQSQRGAIESTLKNAEELSGRLLHTAGLMDKLLTDADGVLVENHKNIYETIRALRDTAYHMEQATRRIRANPSVLLFGAEETPEERRQADETELRLRGRAPRYDKEDPR